MKRWFDCCWFIVAPIVCMGSVFSLCLLFSTWCPSIFVIILMWKIELNATVSLVSWDSQCSLALPLGAVGWSTVCDCGISWSYSLSFFILIRWLRWWSRVRIHLFQQDRGFTLDFIIKFKIFNYWQKVSSGYFSHLVDMRIDWDQVLTVI